MRQLLSNLSLKCKLQSAPHTTATAQKMATIPKSNAEINAEISLDNAVKFYTTQVETGGAISYQLVQQGLGSIGRHSSSILQAGSHGEKLVMICHGLQLRRTRFSSNFLLRLLKVASLTPRSTSGSV